MNRMLAGIDSEYGLLIEGRGAEDQVEDAQLLVGAYPGAAYQGWDYRHESPRQDLRGFRLDRLAVDPEDAKFDAGRTYGRSEEVRNDRVLPNGARFYNDHGHPEYSTPECWSIHELAAHDRAGQLVVQRAAEALAKRSGLAVTAYKNNTDFHGASYGTHESYLAPRRLGFDELYASVTPMLIARTVLCGAGKVGSEAGRAVPYQLSQRADFFVENANAETLFRRPIFNTRDEPHANPREWIRLHVISGDANMIPAATALKVGLVKLAIALAEVGEAPIWKLANPVAAMSDISRDESLTFRVDLEGGSWTTAPEILESYFAAAEKTLELHADSQWTITQGRHLLASMRGDFDEFRLWVDWAAKRWMLETFMAEEGLNWNAPSLRAYDLEYHNVDPENGLWYALEGMCEVSPGPEAEELESRLVIIREGTRARARGAAVRSFSSAIRTVGWRTLTLNVAGQEEEFDLDPVAEYPPELDEASDVETFSKMLRGVK